MNTRKFKIIGDGQLIGFILICDNNPNFENCKIGSILRFQTKGEWTENNLEFIGDNLITDLFIINTSDADIQNILIERARISKGDFTNFVINQH